MLRSHWHGSTCGTRRSSTLYALVENDQVCSINIAPGEGSTSDGELRLKLNPRSLMWERAPPGKYELENSCWDCVKAHVYRRRGTGHYYRYTLPRTPDKSESVIILTVTPKPIGSFRDNSEVHQLDTDGVSNETSDCGPLYGRHKNTCIPQRPLCRNVRSSTIWSAIALNGFATGLTAFVGVLDPQYGIDEEGYPFVSKTITLIFSILTYWVVAAVMFGTCGFGGGSIAATQKIILDRDASSKFMSLAKMQPTDNAGSNKYCLCLDKDNAVLLPSQSYYFAYLLAGFGDDDDHSPDHEFGV